MDTLVDIAEATDDAAFLMRARGRLLPMLDAPKTQTVRAILDWVMFRRARTHLCGPVCEAPPPPGVEAFLVWHVTLDKKEEIPKLKAALDNHNENALAGYKFKRVGILRYRDESAFSEESADSVLAMWEAAKPAPQVVLGRVWETAPATGQGWQNHFRMRNMLKQITALTKTPETGALAAIPVPGSTLDDAAFDGGMLVVTMGEVAVPVTKRTALLTHANYDADVHFPSAETFAKAEFENDVPKGDILVAYPKGLAGKKLTVKGVTLATIKPIDPGAKTRLDAVVAGLEAAGFAKPTAARQVTEVLSKPDRDQLVKVGANPDDFDEIIYYEKS